MAWRLQYRRSCPPFHRSKAGRTPARRSIVTSAATRAPKPSWRPHIEPHSKPSGVQRSRLIGGQRRGRAVTPDGGKGSGRFAAIRRAQPPPIEMPPMAVRSRLARCGKRARTVGTISSVTGRCMGATGSARSLSTDDPSTRTMTNGARPSLATRQSAAAAMPMSSHWVSSAEPPCRSTRSDAAGWPSSCPGSGTAETALSGRSLGSGRARPRWLPWQRQGRDGGRPAAAVVRPWGV